MSDLAYYTSETPNLSSGMKTANVLLTGNRKQTAGYTFLLRTRKGIKYIFELRPRKTEWTGYKLYKPSVKIPEYFVENSVIYYI